jgi:glycosyltransferase involved in cell wall biosynthesis
MRRRLAARRAPSGAVLQLALLESAGRLARSFARRLSHLHTDLVVSQSLLPHLWRENVLQGRQFDVLLDRLPYDRLHETLDAAFARYPDSSTLGEYRAPGELVEAERAGLAAARRLITPHLALAKLFPNRTIAIDWQAVPPMKAHHGGRALLMPASSLARKGAYALRAALEGLDTELIVSGHAIERPGFWGDLPVRILDKDEPMPRLAGVVLPALIEHRPEPLLAALGAGLPVIATDACGLLPRPGLTLVARDDAEALHAALTSLLDEAARRTSCSPAVEMPK